MPKGFRANGFMRLLKAQHPQPCPQMLVEHAIRLKRGSTNIYAIYRNPETRLLSAFHYHLHAPGMAGWDHEHLLVPRCIYLCVAHVKADACGAQVLTQTPYACPQCMPDVSPYTRVNREAIAACLDSLICLLIHVWYKSPWSAASIQRTQELCSSGQHDNHTTMI